MKVKDLLDALRNLDPELDVYCYTEDEEVLRPGRFGLLDIEYVDVAEGTKRTDVDGNRGITFGRGPESEKFAFINVTGDF